MPAWGSFIVAAVAFLQYWLIGAWRRFFRQGTIDVHETGFIEIGFSNWGPTVGLHGTFRAVHGDVFVSRADLVVVRRRDQSRHSFEWVAFRGAGETIELPAGFLISPQQPHRYNTVWADSDTRSDVLSQVRGVQEQWTNELIANTPNTDDDRYALWGEVSDGTVHVNAHSELMRICYWDAGEYTLELQVQTTRPEKALARSWKFRLTDQDAQLLRLNAITILRSVTNFNDIPYHFAYPTYEES